MLIELIYKGLLHKLNFTFLRNILMDAREVRFNFPELNFAMNIDEVIKTINSNSYVDLIINMDFLEIKEKIVPNVFINLSRNNDEIEVLFFLDLVDLKEATPKSNIDYLKNWAIEFTKKYNIEYFVCQIDNAEKDEYYFDSNGIGKLYKEMH